MLNAILCMERPGLRHRLRGPQPFGLSGLFAGRLVNAHIFGNGRQYIGRMVAQLFFAHIRVGRHKRFSEGGDSMTISSWLSRMNVLSDIGFLDSPAWPFLEQAPALSAQAAEIGVLLRPLQLRYTKI